MKKKENSTIDLNKIHELANKKIASLGDSKEANGIVSLKYKGKTIEVPYFQSNDDCNGWVLSRPTK